MAELQSTTTLMSDGGPISIVASPSPEPTPDIKDIESLIFYSTHGRYQPLAGTDPAFELIATEGSDASLTTGDEYGVLDYNDPSF